MCIYIVKRYKGTSNKADQKNDYLLSVPDPQGHKHSSKCVNKAKEAIYMLFIKTGNFSALCLQLCLRFNSVLITRLKRHTNSCNQRMCYNNEQAKLNRRKKQQSFISRTTFGYSSIKDVNGTCGHDERDILCCRGTEHSEKNTCLMYVISQAKIVIKTLSA